MATNQRAPRAPEITRIKFLSINRDIKASVAAGNWNADRIAKAHHVSDETVRAIKRTKTWPAWEIAKQVRRGQRNATYVLPAKAPEQRSLELAQPVSDPESDQMAKELKDIEQFVTRAEFSKLQGETAWLRARIEELELAAVTPRRRTIFGGIR